MTTTRRFRAAATEGELPSPRSERSHEQGRYISESDAELSGTAAAGQVGDRRGRRHARRAGCSTRPSAPLSSTCASWTNGPRDGFRARSTSRAATSSRASSRRAPDRAQPIFLYCAAGNRSAFAAKSLEELGYENVVSLAGGYTDWKRSGFPTELPRTLDGEKRQRYSRHVLIPEVGEEGQLKLLDSRVLLLGAGGLGSPSALYLAAAGVGRSGSSTTTRSTPRTSSARCCTRPRRLGEWKAESAKRTLEELNPDVEVVPTSSGSRRRTSSGSSPTAGT